MQGTQDRVSLDEFDLDGYSRNPWHVRRTANCPECGAPAGAACRGVQGLRTFHPERRAHARHIVTQALTALREHQAGAGAPNGAGASSHK